MIERFPTHLILKTLPKVDRKRIYLREAYKFIKQEKVREAKAKAEHHSWFYNGDFVVYILDLLAWYKKWNCANELSVQSKESSEGERSHFDNSSSAGPTARLSIGYQTICYEISFEVGENPFTTNLSYFPFYETSSGKSEYEQKFCYPELRTIAILRILFKK